LVVNDAAFAESCLKHHGYYRLSAYRFPLTVHGSPDQFLPGVTFEQLWALYDFDRRLRGLVLEASKRAEISIRSRWAYEVGHRHGALAYEQSAFFKNSTYHQKALTKLDEELTRSQEEFVAHFRNQYGMTRPPIWAACEVMTFGQVSNFYSLLADPGLRQVIADTYGLDERALVSFLHHLECRAQHLRPPRPPVESPVCRIHATATRQAGRAYLRVSTPCRPRRQQHRSRRHRTSSTTPS